MCADEEPTEAKDHHDDGVQQSGHGHPPQLSTLSGRRRRGHSRPRTLRKADRHHHPFKHFHGYSSSTIGHPDGVSRGEATFSRLRLFSAASKDFAAKRSRNLHPFAARAAMSLRREAAASEGYQSIARGPQRRAC